MHHDLLQWGESLRYPAIVLRRDPRDVLKAGRDTWQQLLSSGDEERIERLRERRVYFQRVYIGNLV